MVRPCKFRTVGFNPNYTYFKPRAIPLSELEEVELKLDELEAIKLADLEELYHEDAAKKMNVSRQTFDRILIQAHKTTADALVHGKAILIKGGKVMSSGNNVHRPLADRGCSGGGRGGRGICRRTGQKG